MGFDIVVPQALPAEHGAHWQPLVYSSYSLLWSLIFGMAADLVKQTWLPQGLQIQLGVHKKLKPLLQVDVLLTITTACYYYATTRSTLLCLGYSKT